jgi:hypothetical protein
MDKLVSLPKYDKNGQPTVSQVHPGVLEKTASELHPEIKECISKLKPRVDGIYILVNALGAGEYWGQNSNGDWFGEEALKHEGPDYGHKTFELYAHPFLHHQNRDPLKSIGEKVIKSVWNDKMKRVEVVYFICRDKAKDIVEKIEAGESPNCSMGCKVPYDVCSICLNQAKTTANYCDHLRYEMGKTYPDGSKVYAINTRPKFFDISHVIIGADKTARVLMKVASQEDGSVVPSAILAEQLGIKFAEDKQADIVKDVPAEVEDTHLAEKANLAKKTMVSHGLPVLSAVERDIPDSSLKQLAAHPLSETLTTISHMGMALKPREFGKILVIKLKGNEPVSSESCKCAGAINPSVVAVMRKHAEERSGFPVYLSKRAVKIASSSPTELAAMVEDNRQAIDYEYAPEYGDLIDVAGSNSDLSTRDKIASLYEHYRSRVNSLDLEKFASTIDESVDLTAFVNGSGHNNAAYLAELMLSGGQADKTASAAKTLGGAAALSTAPYLAGAHYQIQKARGKQVSGIGDSLSSPGVQHATAAAAGYGGYKGLKALEESKKKKAKADKKKLKLDKRKNLLKKVRGKLKGAATLAGLAGAGALAASKMDKKAYDEVSTRSESVITPNTLGMVKKAALSSGPEQEAAIVSCLVIGGHKLGFFK